MIETERLILEPLTMAHAPGQFDVLKDPQVSGQIGIFGQPFTLKQAEWWCGEVAEGCHVSKTGMLCAIFKKAADGKKDGPAIGYVGTAQTDEKMPADKWEVGYWIKKEDWRQGFVAEGLKAVMNYAAQTFGVKIFYAEMAQTNTGSFKVAEKCGFQRTEEFFKKTPTDPQRPSYRYEREAPHAA